MKTFFGMVWLEKDMGREKCECHYEICVKFNSEPWPVNGLTISNKEVDSKKRKDS